MSNHPTNLIPFYIVATPIGNLSDMGFRAIEVLKNVDVILCEDTRVTQILCEHYDISTKRVAYHAQSSDQVHQRILSGIQEGTTYALVSDAGTPTISDPGVKLVQLIKAQLGGIVDIIPIPGPSALITALSVSGFGGNDFRFFGFIPHKKGRQTFFDQVAKHSSIAVMYESPHRILKTLEAWAEHPQLHKRSMFCARELTKLYEEKIWGTPAELLQHFTHYPDRVRGEFVLVCDRRID